MLYSRSLLVIYLNIDWVFGVLSVFILHTYAIDVVHIKTHNNEFWGEREENWTGKGNRGNFNCIYKVLLLSKVT